jgi:arginyl-tRNA synthetase
LTAAGFAVEREFYINDAGTQVEMLARSVLARYRQSYGLDVGFPKEGYHGEYVRDLAAKVREEYGEKFLDLPDQESLPVIGECATRLMLEELQGDLDRFGVSFDSWFSEKGLLSRWDPKDRTGLLQAIRDLYGPHVYERDGAVWLATTAFGDDKDRVLIRANGEPTYFLSDCFYHRDKFERGFDRLVDVWGADHHGYIPRVKAALQSLGYPAEDFHVVLVQMVSVLREAEKAGLPGPYHDAPVDVLDLPEELTLLKQLALYPEVVEEAAVAYEPHRIPAYLQNLAGELHSYYNKVRIINPDQSLSRARLALVSAIRTVLASGLGLLGVVAPDRM